MANIKTQKGSFYMRNYYNYPRPQFTSMSFLFTCKCIIFYYKSRNVYYYFHFIFGKYSPKYLFEFWRGEANIIIEYIETKWYIKLTKFGYYRVKISHIIQQGLIWTWFEVNIPIWGTHKFGRQNSSKVEKEKLTFCKQIKVGIWSFYDYVNT